jgi:anti-sigma regulatory factor (Ser/Thr protein kinase)
MRRTNLRLTVRARQSAPRTVRVALHGWLTAIGWDIGDTELIVVAVNEAVTNSVKHAFPHGRAGQIQVRAEQNEDRLEIKISDNGRWRDSDPAQSHMPRGITLMHALVDTASVTDGPDGTVVSLISNRADPDPYQGQHASDR